MRRTWSHQSWWRPRVSRRSRRSGRAPRRAPARRPGAARRRSAGCAPTDRVVVAGPRGEAQDGVDGRPPGRARSGRHSTMPAATLGGDRGAVVAQPGRQRHGLLARAPRAAPAPDVVRAEGEEGEEPRAHVGSRPAPARRAPPGAGRSRRGPPRRRPAGAPKPSAASARAAASPRRRASAAACRRRRASLDVARRQAGRGQRGERRDRGPARRAGAQLAASRPARSGPRPRHGRGRPRPRARRRARPPTRRRRPRRRARRAASDGRRRPAVTSPPAPARRRSAAAACSRVRSRRGQPAVDRVAHDGVGKSWRPGAPPPHEQLGGQRLVERVGGVGGDPPTRRATMPRPNGRPSTAPASRPRWAGGTARRPGARPPRARCPGRLRAGTAALRLQHARELVGEERVAVRPAVHDRGRRGAVRAGRQQPAHVLGARAPRSAIVSAPARAAAASAARWVSTTSTRAAPGAGHVAKERERGGVGPVEVLQHDDLGTGGRRARRASGRRRRRAAAGPPP